MNIFYLDDDPIIAAQYLIDTHCSKMQSESAQMLANCYDLCVLADAPKTQKGKVRKYSYFNHPCSVWVRESIDNFNWLVEHATAMYLEKIFRTGKPHFSYSFTDWCRKNPPNLPKVGLTQPAQCFSMYTSLIDPSNPVQAYRRFYVCDKTHDKNGKRIDQWTKRGKPYWFSEEL